MPNVFAQTFVYDATDPAGYPDSDKIGVSTPNAEDQFMLRRRHGNEPYYAGEA